MSLKIWFGIWYIAGTFTKSIFIDFDPSLKILRQLRLGAQKVEKH